MTTTTPVQRLRERSRLRPADPPGDLRFAASARCHHSSTTSTDGFLEWFEERSRAHRFQVQRIDFRDMDRWRLEPGTGNLRHDSGRFFSIEGLRVRTDLPGAGTWSQPIIHQPEHGLLGLLVREVDGHFEFLVQAKMEPGNINLIQLSPTVQATRSNYTQVHKGARTPYLEHFIGVERGRVLVDVLQSEQGDSFHRKRNRNMVVEVRPDLPVHEDFRWLTLGQIADLMRIDNLVNMDTRTVLSCIPFRTTPAHRRDLVSSSAGRFPAGLAESFLGDDRALHDTPELLSWLTELRSVHEMHTDLIPLAEVSGWTTTADAVEHEDRQYPSVVAVRVSAGSREVGSWTQPLILPHHQGLAAFLVQRVEGVPHVLMQAKAQPGLFDTFELAPTVQCVGRDHRTFSPAERPPFLDDVLRAPAAWIRYSAVLSEEGGRFMHRENRYIVIEVPDDVSLEIPPSHRFVTPGQLKRLVHQTAQVNVEARTLLACLQGLQ
jgi:dTDP-4-dehydro-6-deoxy-alpha-D-glucopyranose 2,3-dehydratase